MSFFSPETLALLGIKSQHITVALAILGILGVISVIFSVLWAAFKISYQQIYKVPLPETKWTKRIDLVLHFALNIPGAVNKHLKDSGKLPLFLKSSDSSTPPPSP